jgi:two-component system, NarL family, sensor histidine kinase UhpB
MKHTVKSTVVLNDTESYKSINRFKLLSIATKEGIWEYDFKTKQSFYNDGMTELFGYTAEEMKDNNTWWRNNIHPQDKKRIITELDELLESEKSVWWGKYQFRCSDGSYKLILDRLFVVRDARKKSLRLIGTMQDFTEVDALQQALENVRKEHSKSMARAIFLAEEKERKIISDELNENINQVLAAINIDLMQAKKHVFPEGKTRLQEAQFLLLNSIASIRNIAKSLSPIVLKDLGLKPCIIEMLTVLEEKNNIQYALLVNEASLQKRSIDIQTLLYRIAKHQLQNISKHSTAKNIALKIVPLGKKHKMSIYDDGPGIDLKKIQYGNGFSNIQEKAEAFNGSFNLESIDGKKGFTIEVIV